MKGVIVTLLCLSCVAGCSSRQFTTTPRSAIEQLLLSGAVDRALAKLELSEVQGAKVCLDFANLKAYDVEYIKAATRARFLELGAILVDKPADSGFVVEMACGGLGIESKDSVVGLPALPVPNAPVATPALSAYRSSEQTGIVKLLVFVRQADRLVAVRYCYAKCDRDESSIFGIKFQRVDDIRQGWEQADLQGRDGKAEAQPQ